VCCRPDDAEIRQGMAVLVRDGMCAQAEVRS